MSLTGTTVTLGVLTGSNLINANRTHGPPAAGSPPNGLRALISDTENGYPR